MFNKFLTELSSRQVEPRKPPRESGRDWGAVFLILVAILVFALSIWNAIPRSITEYRVGPTAVLEGPEKIWLFVQINEVEVSLNPSASPTRFADPHSRHIFVIDQNGVQSKEIPVQGPGFHPNLTAFLWWDGHLYLIEIDTLRVYEWRDSHFARLEQKRSERLISALQLSDTPLPCRESRIDATMAESPFTLRYHKRTVKPDFEVKSATKQLRLAMIEQNGTNQLQVKYGGSEAAWTATILEFRDTANPPDVTVKMN